MLKTIVKREGSGLVLFFPESRANRGMIVRWSPDEGHTEASMEYYWGLKNPPKDQDVSGLIETYARIGEYTPMERVYRDSAALRSTRWDY